MKEVQRVCPSERRRRELRHRFRPLMFLSRLCKPLLYMRSGPRLENVDSRIVWQIKPPGLPR